MKIRTRYAPSPTGYFHVGGARTALFNYLFAKHNNGDFIVRIEDTDIERNVENGTESQLENINWMGIIPDESPLHGGKYGPYFQTQKLQRYEELANQLLNEQKAYYCFCTKEQLDAQRKEAELNHETPKYNRTCLHLSESEIYQKLNSGCEHTIRLKIDENKMYEWDDLIRGKISIPGSALTDPVILKSNKVAMYNFAVVVDDYDMEISHVLRGEEHISNTPYQIAIRDALGFNNGIQYGHLSVIINDDGKKLSKRDTKLKQFISDYREMGYLPITIDNFLSLLGWAPADNNEIMNLQDMIRKFEINHVSKSPTKFDQTKLLWIGNQHFKQLEDSDYLSFVKQYVNSKNEIYLQHQNEVLLLFKNQISYASQIDDLIDDILEYKSSYDAQTMNEIKELIEPIKLIIQYLIRHWNSLTFNSEEQAKELIEKIKLDTGLKGKQLFMSIRIVTTGLSHGPELAKNIYLLAKQNIELNLNKIIKEIGHD